MEISSSKMQIMKPFVLKAGIPLAVITLAGFIVAKIAERLSSRDVQQSDSCEIHHEEARCELQEVILGLKCKIEDLQNREWRLEKRFLHYQDSKEQEIALMELHNKFMLEINRVEFLERDITLLEAAKQRFDSIVREYLVISRLLDFSRTRNKQLRNKLLRKTKEHCRVLRKKGLLIESKETEILKNKTELEVKDDCIRLMGNEIRELKQEIELLLREKNEFSDKSEAEDDNIQLACELYRLQKDEVAEVNELIYIRWQNACLRHELVTRNQEQDQNQKNERNFGEIVGIEECMSDHELSICYAGQSDSNLALTTQNHHSKRRKLIEKLKRIWVEKEKHGK